VVRGVPGKPTSPDPFALVELASDLRPPDYVVRFAELAAQHSGLAQPIAVAAKARPDWLKAVASHSSVAVESLEDALRRFSSL